MRKRIVLLLVLFLSFFPEAYAQHAWLKGRVCDSLSLMPMPGVVIEWEDVSGAPLHYLTTGEDGSFQFGNLRKIYRGRLRCSVLGYRTRILEIDGQESDLGTILMQEEIVELAASVRTGQAIRSSQNGDTLTYNAAAYPTMMGASSEDLISRMPGIEVDSRTVEANGKKVSRVMVDGQEFFNDDVMTALRNLPADLVREIEILNQRSDEAEMASMDDGHEVTVINIVTKRKKNEEMLAGRLYGGYGLPDRYIAGASLNSFHQDHSLTLLGMANNISKYNFVSDDLVGASSSDGSAAGSDFSVKPLSGISSVQSLGANYTRKHSNVSYLFNRIDNENDSEQIRRRIMRNGNEQLTGTQADYEAENQTHRVAAKISVAPKSRHSLLVRPELEYQKLADRRIQQMQLREVLRQEAGLDADTLFKHDRLGNTGQDRWKIRSRLVMIYRCRFSRPGRNLSVSVNGNYSRSEGDAVSRQYTFLKEDMDFNPEMADGQHGQIQDRNNGNGGLGVSATYTEPLNQCSRMAVFYRYQSDYSNGIQQTRLYRPSLDRYDEEPDPKQSSSSRQVFMIHSAGVRYNYKLKKTSLTASLNYQHTGFRGRTLLPQENRTRRGFNDLIYNLVANIPFNAAHSLRVEANSNTLRPSVFMMQDVVNLNNLSDIRAGNPRIVPSYIHNLKLRYIHTDSQKGRTLSASFNLSASPDYLSDSLVVDAPEFEVADGVLLGDGNQYRKPVNMGGYYRLRGRFSLGLPVAPISGNLNFNVSASSSSVPGMVNEEKIPVHRNDCSLGVKLEGNVQGRLDYGLSYNGQLAENEIAHGYGKVKNNFLVQKTSGRVKWQFWKDFLLTGSLVYHQNRSLDDRFNDRLVFCDLFVGKHLFKGRTGEISIGVNDLFNQTAERYHHGISANGAMDHTDRGMGRQFLVQLVWHLRK